MFKKAIPVWIRGRESEMNLASVFTAYPASLSDCTLFLTASTFYRLFVNGRFVSFGPARTAKGYARVDMLRLSDYDNANGENEIRIEVVSYHCRSLSTCLSVGFLSAELRRGEEVLLYTGRDFRACVLTEKEQYTERYSVQRHFMEAWDFTKVQSEEAEWEPITEKVTFLPRALPDPHYEEILVSEIATGGRFELSAPPPAKKNRYSWSEIPEMWGRFEEDMLCDPPYRRVMQAVQTPIFGKTPFPWVLRAGEYAIFDLSQIECGFWKFSGRSSAGASLLLAFSEASERDPETDWLTFSFSRINCQNVISYRFPPGDTGEVQSFEPYTARYLILLAEEGDFTLTSFGLCTFEREMVGAKDPSFPSPVHARIYEAAKRTLAHNAVDLYTDCPSRERAGWLCDSYFTGAAEYRFFGEAPVEAAFLENYRLCEDPILPKGMLPMCYPSDTKRDPDGGGHHIPQWCMWYVLEVRDYLLIRNRSASREDFRKTVEGIVCYLEKFENEDGLLEDLPSWNFVEWSDANKWTRNVNYPTNFLYAAVLLAAHELYGNEALREKAVHVQKKAAERSFDGEVFTDNALRNAEGRLENTGNTSEAGQYYAYLFGNLDLSNPRYARYRRHLLSGCRELREGGRYIVPVNAFIGLYLRLKALLALGEYTLLLRDVESFFGAMADKTGTLWEYREGKGSLDHGFASYAAYAMCAALEALEEGKGDQIP